MIWGRFKSHWIVTKSKLGKKEEDKGEQKEKEEINQEVKRLKLICYESQ